MTTIAHVTSVHSWNDTRIYLKMARSLARAGVATHLVAIDRNAAEDRTFDSDGVTVHLLAGMGIHGRRQRMLRGGPLVMDRLEGISPDLVHFHDPELIPIALLRSGRHRFIYDAHENVPELVYSRDWLPEWLRAPLKVALGAMEAFACARFDGVIGATPTIAGRFTAAKSTCIQNLPIPGELSSPDGVPMDWQVRPMRGIYVGGISELRGILPLIDALDKCPLIEGFDLVGTFDSQDLKNRAISSPGWKKVTYHGQLGRMDVARLLNSARFGAVTFLPAPNHVDAQPNKLFEYLSSGLPVLASHFPLWRQILGPRLASYVDPSDASSVATGMTHLLSATLDEQRARSNLAQQRIAEELNWDREFERLLAFYNSLLKS